MSGMTEKEFVGRWRFERGIEDARAGQVIRVQGIARFEPRDGHVLYVEDGELHLPGQAPMRAERRYLWAFDGAEVAVRFDDGRPFHQFRPDGKAEGTAHLCGEDLYKVAYDFTGWPVWTSVWQVQGPRKDYCSRTRYERLA